MKQQLQRMLEFRTTRLAMTVVSLGLLTNPTTAAFSQEAETLTSGEKLSQGLEPNHVPDYRFEPTPLFSVKNPEMAEVAIKAGVDLETRNEHGWTALFFIAAYVKNPAPIIQVLLQHGANPNARDNEGNTPLMCARDATAVDALVAAGADINAKNKGGRSAYNFLGTKYEPDRDEALSRHGLVGNTRDTTVSPFLMAIIYKDFGTAKRLLRFGAEPDEEARLAPPMSPMSFAVGIGSFEIATEMRRVGGKDVGLLSQAAAEGNVAGMKQLLREGASVMEKTGTGRTPLHFAVHQGRLESVRFLLENGAIPDAPDSSGETPVKYAQQLKTEAEYGFQNTRYLPPAGMTALDLADFSNTVVPLLEATAAGNDMIDGSGDTSVTRAAAIGDISRLTYLKKQGANINYQRPDGLTALMIVVMGPSVSTQRTQNTLPFIEALLKLGADPSIRNRVGKTALDLARDGHNPEIVALLENPPKAE